MVIKKLNYKNLKLKKKIDPLKFLNFYIAYKPGFPKGGRTEKGILKFCGDELILKILE